MKKWRCQICGYIHEGETPPEHCPVCGASKDKFELLDGKNGLDSKERGMVPTTTKADVIVISSGAAAYAAAITARSKGASVIMLEKAYNHGGTTMRSGGALWIPNNRHQKEMGLEESKEDAIKYMARYFFPHLYNEKDKQLGLPENNYELIKTYVDEASKMDDYMESIGALKTIIDINWTGKPQPDYLDSLPENKKIRGRSVFPMNQEGSVGYGAELISQLSNWSQTNNIQLFTGHQVTEICKDEKGKVVGVVSKMDDGKIYEFTANKGVIFGSGGYSHNKEMMLSYQRGPHFGGCSVPTNTGDFITMANRIGAKIGNTAGAFRAQSMFEAVLENPDGANNAFYIGGDSVFEVNRYGQRVMDEKRDYTDRAMMHFVWDPIRAEWMNMLLFAIFDKRVANLWGGMAPYPPTLPSSYVIEGNTLEEVTENIKLHLESHKEHTGGFELDESFLNNLLKTKEQFNEYAKTGIDKDFKRGEFNYDREFTTFPPLVPNAEVEWPPKESKNYTMYPLSDEGPYYAVILAAGTLDTCGGPVINHKGQVLDADGKIIKGLYGAGNCIASPVANAYWGAGAMTFGYLAVY